MWNISAQQGRIPWAIFKKIAAFVPRDALAVNFVGFAQGVTETSGFQVDGSGYPQIFSAP